MEAPPRPGVLDALREQLAKDANNKQPEFCDREQRVLLSFIGDCYQPHENGFTRQALEILVENNVPFTVLTKGGMRAAKDFDLYGNGLGHFATTLLFTDDEDRKQWEPGAASVQQRIDAIKAAHGQGIYTWVSIEPVIDPSQALQLIQHTRLIVDEFRVGKLNYHAHADAIDWAAFALEVQRLLSAGGHPYLIKDALAKYLPPGIPQRYPNEPQAPFLGGLFCEWPQNRHRRPVDGPF